jgi:hypothetical protein
MAINNFNPINLEIEECSSVNCEIFTHKEEDLILCVKLSGVCGIGSQGENYGNFLYQKIGLALLTYQPLAVLVDMRELEYTYGDRILSLFEIFEHVRPYQIEFKIITAFVLSDKNKAGLSGLVKTDNPGFFEDFDKAYQYVWERYDLI